MDDEKVHQIALVVRRFDLLEVHVKFSENFDRHQFLILLIKCHAHLCLTAASEYVPDSKSFVELLTISVVRVAKIDLIFLVDFGPVFRYFAILYVIGTWCSSPRRTQLLNEAFSSTLYIVIDPFHKLHYIIIIFINLLLYNQF